MFGRDETYVQDLGVKIEAAKPLFFQRINVYTKRPPILSSVAYSYKHLMLS
jgi:hypothetical protein